jgi:hypothetical protein
VATDAVHEENADCNSSSDGSVGDDGDDMHGDDMLGGVVAYGYAHVPGGEKESKINGSFSSSIVEDVSAGEGGKNAILFFLLLVGNDTGGGGDGSSSGK